MLISHSIIPSLIIVGIGLVFHWIALIISGLGYFIHILFDTIDWGTNFFGIYKKPIGIKLLITKEEFRHLSELLGKYKEPYLFFDDRYFNNKIIMLIEFLVFGLMVLSIGIFAFEYAFVGLLYFPFLIYHQIGYYIHIKRN